MSVNNRLFTVFLFFPDSNDEIITLVSVMYVLDIQKTADKPNALEIPNHRPSKNKQDYTLRWWKKMTSCIMSVQHAIKSICICRELQVSIELGHWPQKVAGHSFLSTFMAEFYKMHGLHNQALRYATIHQLCRRFLTMKWSMGVFQIPAFWKFTTVVLLRSINIVHNNGMGCSWKNGFRVLSSITQAFSKLFI